MTKSLKDRSATDQLHRLLGSQLLIRATVSRSALKTAYEHCLVEVVSFNPDLHDGSITRPASGFVHLAWTCGYEERKSIMHSSPFHFYSLAVKHGVTGEDALKETRSCVVRVMEHWELNATGDGAQPHKEWLEPKPYVAVASLGIRPDARIEWLGGNNRPLLAYFGCLLGKLDGYLAHLKMICEEYDPDLEERYLLLGHLTYQFRSFVHQTQLGHFDLLF